jgi:phospholipase C
VIEALTANPTVWSKTVLFVMFDENDGFFDHVPPPCAPSLNPDLTRAGASTVADATERHTDGNVYGPGPRVPMIVVSPWSRGGWVCSEAFDHTSLVRFLEARFGVTEPNVSPWRRTVLGDLTSAFNFRRPNHRPFPALPTTTRAQADAVRNAQQALPQVPIPTGAAGAVPQQNTGVRPSRALPYALHVDATVDAGAGTVGLTFGNVGAQGAVLHVYDRRHLDAVPRRYTVGVGSTLHDTWAVDPDGSYDLWVMGPNGFLRHLQGTAGAAAPSLPDVTTEYGRALTLNLRNDGTAACTFVVRANAYRRVAPQSVSVGPGETVPVRWPLGSGRRWYDVSVTCDADAGFLRRLAGRVENGRPGVTDPMMGVA